METFLTQGLHEIKGKEDGFKFGCTSLDRYRTFILKWPVPGGYIHMELRTWARF